MTHFFHYFVKGLGIFILFIYMASFVVAYNYSGQPLKPLENPKCLLIWNTVAGVGCILFGFILNRSKFKLPFSVSGSLHKSYSFQTHSLFWINMEHWGYIFLAYACYLSVTS